MYVLRSLLVGSHCVGSARVLAPLANLSTLSFPWIPIWLGNRKRMKTLLIFQIAFCIFLTNGFLACQSLLKNLVKLKNYSELVSSFIVKQILFKSKCEERENFMILKEHYSLSKNYLEMSLADGTVVPSGGFFVRLQRSLRI